MGQTTFPVSEPPGFNVEGCMYKTFHISHSKPKSGSMMLGRDLKSSSLARTTDNDGATKGHSLHDSSATLIGRRLPIIFALWPNPLYTAGILPQYDFHSAATRLRENNLLWI